MTTMNENADTVLSIKNVSVGYKKVKVINQINFSLQKDQKLGILGRNGVGKTTLMKGMIGLLPSLSGSIEFDGKDITKLAAYKRSNEGIAYVPQGREIFADLTVRENLQMGSVAYLKANKEVSLKQQINKVMNFFPDLVQHMDRKGGVLSGGQQQQLSIARALMSNPKVLLLDEPTDGIQPNVVEKLASTLNEIQKQMHVSLVLVEQNLVFSKEIINDFIILQKGNIVCSGKVNELTDEVTSKYLAI